jgi:hypothetical protein
MAEAESSHEATQTKAVKLLLLPALSKRPHATGNPGETNSEAVDTAAEGADEGALVETVEGASSSPSSCKADFPPSEVTPLLSVPVNHEGGRSLQLKSFLKLQSSLRQDRAQQQHL